MLLLYSFLLCGMLRIMVDLLFDVFEHIFRLNHIRLPAPGWELELIKVVFVVMLAVSFLASYMVLHT